MRPITNWPKELRKTAGYTGVVGLLMLAPLVVSGDTHSRWGGFLYTWFAIVSAPMALVTALFGEREYGAIFFFTVELVSLYLLVFVIRALWVRFRGDDLDDRCN